MPAYSQDSLPVQFCSLLKAGHFVVAPPSLVLCFVTIPVKDAFSASERSQGHTQCDILVPLGPRNHCWICWSAVSSSLGKEQGPTGAVIKFHQPLMWTDTAFAKIIPVRPYNPYTKTALGLFGPRCRMAWCGLANYLIFPKGVFIYAAADRVRVFCMD
jgi:hypothetical protein